MSYSNLFARLNVERDVLEDQAVTIIFGQVLYGNICHGENSFQCTFIQLVL